jgi:predicted transcriptional regulator
MKTENNGQSFNFLTSNVGNASIAKSIIEGILIDSDFSETTIDSLIMLFEAFAEKESLLDVKDFAHDLQCELFTKSLEYSNAVRSYVEKIKEGKNYRFANTAITS